MRTLFLLAALSGILFTGPAAAQPPKKPAARHHAATAPATRDWTKAVAPTADGGMLMGNPKAPVTLIEYGSRTCPHCALFDKEGLPALRQKYIASGQVSYEFREFPVHGALDVAPILLGKCVSPAKFFPLLDLMMSSQPQLLNKPKIPDEDEPKLRAMAPGPLFTWLATYYGYLDLMTKHGMAPARANACLNDQKAIDALAKNTDAANSRYSIAGTPTFIVNGTVKTDAHDWATLEPALQAAGAH